MELNLTELITEMCNAIVNDNTDARALYSSLKKRVPNEAQRLEAVIKVVDERYHSHFLVILSALSSFDGSHASNGTET